jgi:predicted secreted protein
MFRTYSEDADGSSVALRVHDDFEVSLPESRTGGYKWKLAEAGAPILKSEELPSQTSDTSVPGGRSNRSWRFTAEQPGSTQLRMLHQRSWESEPGREFRLNVTVAA